MYNRLAKPQSDSRALNQGLKDSPKRRWITDGRDKGGSGVLLEKRVTSDAFVSKWLLFSSSRFCLMVIDWGMNGKSRIHTPDR